MSQTLRAEYGTGRLSEEECLLGPARNRPNTEPNDRGYLPGFINDKDIPQKHAREKKIPKKNLKESCYNRIECTVVIFLTAFMWRRPLNSITLATATHKKLRKVSDGTDTQVRAQMINKCRIKMTQKGLYNGRDPLSKGGRRKKERRKRKETL